MMQKRGPLQGVWNIMRFNWHFYIVSLAVSVFFMFLSTFLSTTFRYYIFVLGLLISLPSFVSLLISYYVYDLSGLYNLRWVDDFKTDEKSQIVNINAGFDETSMLLHDKFPTSDLTVLDFYDPAYHTEVSIKRAKKVYPPFPNTKAVTTDHLALADHSADRIFIIFAAHEIRNAQERLVFFRELKRIIKPAGQIIVTEHLRDVSNFLAYNIGFLHFFSKSDWLNTFRSAGLLIKKEKKCTPFISTFTLTKNGVTS
ncbi:MAG: methyltransferase domain-containing protein [Ferruginibacter sp.]